MKSILHFAFYTVKEPSGYISERYVLLVASSSAEAESAAKARIETFKYEDGTPVAAGWKIDAIAPVSFFLVDVFGDVDYETIKSVPEDKFSVVRKAAATK